MDLFRSPGGILNVRTLPPFGNRLRIDTLLSGHAPYARLTSLNCSTYCLCRSGSAMDYLYHNCSFSILDTVPLYSGTKHLVGIYSVNEQTVYVSPNLANTDINHVGVVPHYFLHQSKSSDAYTKLATIVSISASPTAPAPRMTCSSLEGVFFAFIVDTSFLFPGSSCV